MSSEKVDPIPAPFSMFTVKPALMSFSTDSGVWATRFSMSRTSFGIPMVMSSYLVPDPSACGSEFQHRRGHRRKREPGEQVRKDVLAAVSLGTKRSMVPAKSGRDSGVFDG